MRERETESEQEPRVSSSISLLKTGVDVMIFQNISAKNLTEKLPGFCSNYC
jgi:hypothetical protein